MAPALLIALALASYFGFALLALSQDRHWERAGGGRDCPRRLVLPLRIAGYGLLLAALAIALWRDGCRRWSSGIGRRGRGDGWRRLRRGGRLRPSQRRKEEEQDPQTTNEHYAIP